MKFDVIIPTYNRSADLTACLDSIHRQTLPPNIIFIIDDGELREDFIAATKSKFSDISVELVYYKKDHNLDLRGSSESRNKAMSLVQNEVFFILDDDLILDKDFFANIMAMWTNSDPKLLGVGGVIKNNRKKLFFERIFNIFFGLASSLKWDVNGVGYQVWDDSIHTSIKGNYLHGGVASYRRREILALNGFTSFGQGRSALEDVDFCLRAKNTGYHFIVEPKARVIHKQSSTAREHQFVSGIKESINRKIIFRKECRHDFYHQLWFVWASMGWILRQFLTAHFSKGFGMINGFIVKQ